jgi:aspartyl-tRNA(Asn)/glutamyl-tRNA(Gln) amidotransferase subunit C|nr:Asp-tRNA(Asn)/Glu-tRNA(Gln) amidotransferase subunit GatC [Kofleriaceae bacterium]
MTTLSREEVEAIALLARLHLERDEAERMQAELGAIVDYFGALAGVACDGVEPMTHAVPAAVPLRADEPEPSLAVADVLRGAPAVRDDLFVVPAIIPGGD